MDQNDLDELHEVEVEEPRPLERVFFLKVAFDLPLLVVRHILHLHHELLWVKLSFLEFNLLHPAINPPFFDPCVGDLFVITEVVEVDAHGRLKLDEVVVVVHEKTQVLQRVQVQDPSQVE